jgi:hypothetical protein
MNSFVIITRYLLESCFFAFGALAPWGELDISLPEKESDGDEDIDDGRGRLYRQPYVPGASPGGA